ncbi:MAG: hypothetical protein WB543_09935, partial [Candidatus Acidiferrum sp.]
PIWEISIPVRPMPLPWHERPVDNDRPLGGIGRFIITSALSSDGCHGNVTLFAAKRDQLRIKGEQR